jgi:hypothetical protein
MEQTVNISGRYTQQHIPDPENDDIMTIEVWNKWQNQFYDQGIGYWMKDGYVSKDEVFSTPAQDATHVLWFNK